MNVGSLFSGIGGIELGFEKTGYTTSWFIEYEPYAQAILRKRFPNTPIYGDITTIDFGNLPKVDILTGGFPCQDISNAGKRAGITGSRSSLWKHYCEAIRIIRPQFALIENVAALAKRGLNVVLADLAKIGYDAEWYNLSASAVGAHHQRERLFILAYPNDSRHIHGQAQEQPTEGRQYALGEPEPSSADVAETAGDGREGTGKDERRFVRSCEKRWMLESEGRGNEKDVDDSSSIRHGKENGETQEERSKSPVSIVGGCKDVPDTDKKRLQGREETRDIGESWQDREKLTSGYDKDVPDTDKDGAKCEADAQGWESDTIGSSHRRRGEAFNNDEGSRWAVESGLGGTPYGLPERVDCWNTDWEEGTPRITKESKDRANRIKCLGNAVVPQVAEIFAQAIKEVIMTPIANNTPPEAGR